MRTSTIALALSLIAGQYAVAQAPRAAAASEPKIFSTPWDGTRPRDPHADQKGNVWFVGQQGNYVARLDPKTGEFKRYTVDEGTHPHNLVVDAKGMVWFTGNRNARIVQLDPATGKLTNFMMPDPKVRDPHTMIFDGKGDAWFTAQGASVVGRLTTGHPKARAEVAEVREFMAAYGEWKGLAGEYLRFAAAAGLLGVIPARRRPDRSPRPAGTRWSAPVPRRAAA